MANLDPDFRKLPSNPADPSTFCSRCQQDITDTSKAIRVTIDWDTWETKLDERGTYLLGRDCAKKIGLKA